MSLHEPAIYPEVFDVLEFRFEGEDDDAPDPAPISIPTAGAAAAVGNTVSGGSVSPSRRGMPFSESDPYDPDGQDFVFERPVYTDKITLPDAAVVLKEKLRETVMDKKEYWDPVRRMVTSIAHTGLEAVRNLKDDIKSMQSMYQKPVFGMTFSSRSLPFEFSTDPKTFSVVVTAITGPIEDSRLTQGIVIVGVNQTMLNVGPSSDLEFEEQVERLPLPFTLIFEDQSVEHLDANDTVDAEFHGGAPAKEEPTSARKSPVQAPAPSAAAAASAAAGGYGSFLNTGLSRMSGISSLIQKSWTAPGESAGAPAAPAAGAAARPTSGASFSPPGADDHYFPVQLTGRSPPFVFDLHADGMSIVVAKLVGKGNSSSASSASGPQLLQEGCVIRYINDTEVVCNSRQDFDGMLSKAELPIVLKMERAPALYRHQDALSLFTAGSQEKKLHVFTVMPAVIEPAENPAQRAAAGKTMLDMSSYGGASVQYEDTLETAGRAMSVLQSLRAQGVAVEMRSIETVAVGDGGKHVSLSGLLGGKTVCQGVYSSIQPSSGLLNGIRVWFHFTEAMNSIVAIADAAAGDALVAALDVNRSQSKGGWIVLKCTSASSPWVHEGGMILGRPYLLTHVNGYDVSATGYRSVEPRVRRGDGSWEESVLPLFKRCSRIRFTIA
jgi:hypothetical protein